MNLSKVALRIRRIEADLEELRKSKVVKEIHKQEKKFRKDFMKEYSDPKYRDGLDDDDLTLEEMLLEYETEVKKEGWYKKLRTSMSADEDFEKIMYELSLDAQKVLTRWWKAL